MAEWKGIVEERLARLEEAMKNIAGILVDQSERIDYGFRVGREENAELRKALTERLDRLIAATIRDRTQTADRLADIELRLTRLETREQG